MAWLVGPLLQLTGGSLVYFFQVMGKNPQQSNYVKRWQYVERWNWLFAAIGMIDWAHYTQLNSTLWQTDLFPKANLAVMLGFVGTAALLFYVNDEKKTSAVIDNEYQLSLWVNSASVISGLVLGGMLQARIGLDGGVSDEQMFGPRPDYDDYYGEEDEQEFNDDYGAEEDEDDEYY